MSSVGDCSRGGQSLADVCFVVQAEDGIRDLVRSRGLGDVYKRQAIAARPAGEDDDAARHGLDRGAYRDGEVLGGVHLAPAPGIAGGEHVAGVERFDPRL